MKQNQNGIIYYNTGTKCLPRLAVSLYTLRKVYKGEISILSDGEQSDYYLNTFFLPDKNLNISITPFNPNTEKGKNHHYLSKCFISHYTPFQNSIFIDSDTIILKDISNLFQLSLNHEFVVPQFCQWKSDGPMMTKRIKQWENIYPEEIERALNFGQAVNTGIMAFTKTSQFMTDWGKLALPGKENMIPDEICCQIFVGKYPHKIVDWTYNASCKFSDCSNPDIKVIHYHGRKHVRENLPFNANLWVAQYNETTKNNIANISQWTPLDDRYLKSYLKTL